MTSYDKEDVNWFCLFYLINNYKIYLFILDDILCIEGRKDKKGYPTDKALVTLRYSISYKKTTSRRDFE
jgi:hypothetical protein